VSIWPNSGLITSSIAPPSPLYRPIINPYFTPDEPEAPEGDSLFGLYKMTPIQLGSGVLDYNGNEITHSLSPPPTLLGNYLGSWLTKVEKFAARPSFSVIPISGQYLEQIETVDDQLRRAQELIRKWASPKTSIYDLTFPAILPPVSSPEKSPSDTLSGVYFLKPRSGDGPNLDFSQLYQAFSNTFASAHPVEHRPERNEVSQLLKGFLRSIRSLRQRLHVVHREVKKRLSRPIPRFCGLGWSRRLWFLLHGSHPPPASAFLPA